MTKEKNHSHGGVGSGVLTWAEWRAYCEEQAIIAQAWIAKRRQLKEEHKKFFSQKGPQIKVLKKVAAGIVFKFSKVSWKPTGYFVHYRAKGKKGMNKVR